VESDNQVDRSAFVPPLQEDREYPELAKPWPNNETLLEPVVAAFVRKTALNAPMPYDIKTLVVITRVPVVTTTLCVDLRETGAKEYTEVSESHTVASLDEPNLTEVESEDKPIPVPEKVI
jgi:hypothetical protein